MFGERNNYEVAKFLVWNPATRKTFEDAQCVLALPGIDHAAGTFGFGYEVVVSIVSTLNNDGSLKLCEVKVCNINGHNCWRNIQSFHADPTSIPGCGVYLNSTLNWMALAFPHNSYDITFDELVIVSLDLRNETYTQLLLPRALDGVHLHDFYSDGDDEDFISDQCFGVLKDCLSLFLHSRKTKH